VKIGMLKKSCCFY